MTLPVRDKKNMLTLFQKLMCMISQNFRFSVDKGIDIQWCRLNFGVYIPRCDVVMLLFLQNLYNSSIFTISSTNIRIFIKLNIQLVLDIC